jgi:uncharacterized protein (DUF433 family)
MEKVVKGDPEILEDEPVFPGTRVLIESLFDHFEAGDSSADFLVGFPSVKREQVLASLESRKGARLVGFQFPLGLRFRRSLQQLP